MKKLYIATDKALAIARQHDGEWVVDPQLTGWLHNVWLLTINSQTLWHLWSGVVAQSRYWKNLGKRRNKHYS